MYEVRFHLGRGNYYKHWQIKYYNGTKTPKIFYYNPEMVQLVMTNCELVNNLRIANRVKEKGVKDVCGWVKCSGLDVRFKNFRPLDNARGVWFNPIIDVHWRVENEVDSPADGRKFDTLFTLGKRVYIHDQCLAHCS